MHLFKFIIIHTHHAGRNLEQRTGMCKGWILIFIAFAPSARGQKEIHKATFYSTTLLFKISIDFIPMLFIWEKRCPA